MSSPPTTERRQLIETALDTRHKKGVTRVWAKADGVSGVTKDGRVRPTTFRATTPHHTTQFSQAQAESSKLCRCYHDLGPDQLISGLQTCKGRLAHGDCRPCRDVVLQTLPSSQRGFLRCVPHWSTKPKACTQSLSRRSLSRSPSATGHRVLKQVRIT